LGSYDVIGIAKKLFLAGGLNKSLKDFIGFILLPTDVRGVLLTLFLESIEGCLLMFIIDRFREDLGFSFCDCCESSLSNLTGLSLTCVLVSEYSRDESLSF
jgi:hypothetical protein